MRNFTLTSFRHAKVVVLIGLVAIFALLATGCGGSSSPKEIRKTVALGKPIIAKSAAGKHKVQVIVDVTEGKPSDLANFRLDADEKKMTPWYVRTKLENLGDKIEVTDPVPVVVKPEDDGGLEAKHIGLIGDFPRCKLVNVPDPFPAGATNESCSVYLVPAKSTLAKIVYSETRFKGANRVYEWTVS